MPGVELCSAFNTHTANYHESASGSINAFAFRGDPLSVWKSNKEKFLGFLLFFVLHSKQKKEKFNLEGFVCAVTNCPLLYCNFSLEYSYQHCLIFPVPFIQELYLQLLVSLNLKINEEIYIDNINSMVCVVFFGLGISLSPCNLQPLGSGTYYF